MFHLRFPENNLFSALSVIKILLIKLLLIGTWASTNFVGSKCRSFNKSVDVYAFGLLLWEILSKEVPFKMLDATEIRRRVTAGERPRLQSYGSSKITSLITSSWWVSHVIMPSHHLKLTMPSWQHDLLVTTRQDDVFENPYWLTVSHVSLITVLSCLVLSCLVLWYISSGFRSQSADGRPTFSSVVDELLDIINEVPNSQNMEVCLSFVDRTVRIQCVFESSGPGFDLNNLVR